MTTTSSISRDSDDDSELDDDPDDGEEVDELEAPWTYVPIDPCQAVIAAIRMALGERIPVEFIDRDCDEVPSSDIVLPDPYALKTVSLEKFATAVLPNLPKPTDEVTLQSIRFMGHRLRQLEERYRNIVMICSLPHWPWLRESYLRPEGPIPSHEEVNDPQVLGVDNKSLTFLFGELPFITALYEKARAELEDDENLTVDGVKRLLLAARTRYQQDLGKRGRKITPQLLSQCLQYIRNMTLMDRRMTPNLFTIATASRGVVGDQFTIHVVEAAAEYDVAEPLGLERIRMGIDQGRLPNQEIVPLASRLPGSPVAWRSLELNRRPDQGDSKQWKSQWNPMQQCSWPPEDVHIESLRTRVIDRAMALMGADLARSEKFSTSFKDGIDIRETLRHWYDGDIYVKVLPPSVGTMDAVVMLFDSPADPRDYRWRATWFAEHEEESTIAFYATHFQDEMIGPGVAVATYGGLMFLFPPRPIPDIWQDRRFDFCETLEERLLAATCMYSRAKQVALLSWLPPGAGWRRLAKHFHKTLIHVPMANFGAETIQRLRTFHVLNGRQVRSYAAHFIRKP